MNYDAIAAMAYAIQALREAEGKKPLTVEEMEQNEENYYKRKSRRNRDKTFEFANRYEESAVTSQRIRFEKSIEKAKAKDIQTHWRLMFVSSAKKNPNDIHTYYKPTYCVHCKHIHEAVPTISCMSIHLLLPIETIQFEMI